MSDYPEAAYLCKSTNMSTTLNESDLVFPVNPNSLTWEYSLNKQSFDTYGGRVTQLLSVAISQMTVQGDAGSRANLMNFFEGLKNLQEWQISQRKPLFFFIPSANLCFTLYISNINIGFDPNTVTYPFNLSFEVEESLCQGYADIYGSLSEVITSGAIADLFSSSTTNGGMGFGYGYDTVRGTMTLSSYYAGIASNKGAYKDLSAQYLSNNSVRSLQQNINKTGLGSVNY